MRKWCGGLLAALGQVVSIEFHCVYDLLSLAGNMFRSFPWLLP